MTARCALYVSASHDIVLSQSRTRVQLNRVFCVRFLVFPKFPHVPLGVDGRRLGTKSEAIGLIVHTITFQDFLTYVITIHQRCRQTDGQASSDLITALCTASHGKNEPVYQIYKTVDVSQCTR